MATDYERLFGIRSLNGKVEVFAQDAIRTGVFQAKFRQGRPLTAEDGTLEWDEQRFSRHLAPVTGHMGQFPEQPELTRVVRRSAVAHIKVSKRINPYRVHYERAPGQLRPGAAEYVENEIRDAMNEIMATLEYMSAESLRGTLTVNAANIPGSTQAFTISYSPNTYTASASWATPTTKILSSEMPAIKADIEQLCGLPPAEVLTGTTVEGFIVGNTEVTNFAAPLLGQRLIEQSGVREGPMLGGLRVGGLPWQITEGGYVPVGGSFTRFMPTTDEAIFLPAGLQDVLGFAEGRGMVPTQLLGPATAAAAQMVAPAPGTGWYAYAQVEGDGPFIKLFIGYVGMPIVLRPDAVCVANLIP